jgi:hypothetical protein
MNSPYVVSVSPSRDTAFDCLATESWQYIPCIIMMRSHCKVIVAYRAAAGQGSRSIQRDGGRCCAKAR